MALFETGVSGTPAGRLKGLPTCRAKALYALDQVVAKEEKLALIEDSLEKTFREKQLWFFVNIFMPLLPKETKGVLETGDRVTDTALAWSGTRSDRRTTRRSTRWPRPIPS